MASAKTEGLNYKINGGKFSIFGYSAEIPQAGSKTFVVQSALGLPARVRMPDPVLPQILQTIETDKANGDLDRIKYVLLNAYHAGYMLLEGSLTTRNFADAEEEEPFSGKFGECIMLKPVKLGEYSFQVIIVDGDEGKEYPQYATLDETGDVV